MIGFIGMSHLGICTSAAVATKGFETVGFDWRPEIVQGLQKGQFPISEPGLEEMVKANGSRQRYTNEPKDLANCEVVYISMDVPTDANNKSDVGVVRDLVKKYAPLLKKGTVLVTLSQVPPGFSRPLHEELKAFGVNLYYQVETLIFGIAIERAMRPERYIVGCANPDEKLPAPFEKLLKAFDCPILPMRFESAELSKIAINFYLTSTVTVTNTLAEVCEKIGARWNEIVPALKLDKRIGPYAYLAPGLGIAGGNLERDLVTIQGLSAQHKTESGTVDSWIKNSAHRKDWVFGRLSSAVLDKVKNPKIGILGLAYKAGTHSLKNAPSVEFLKKVKSFEVRAYDPVAKLPPEFASAQCVQVNSVTEAMKDTDVLVVFTPYDEIKSLSKDVLAANFKGGFVIDPFGVLKSEVMPSREVQHHVLGVSV